jgi:alanine racemase
MKTNQSFATWAEIDLTALQTNLKILLQHTKVPIMAVVKANGYGHGFIQITEAAEQAGVNWFGIARPRMAKKMRETGIKANILILGYLAPEKIEEMICLDVSVTIWTHEHIQQVIRAAQSCQTQARVHLLADSGMGRLGCLPEDTLALARTAAGSDWIKLEGFFSHLATADERDPGPTEKQEKVFQGLVDQLSREKLLPDIIHLANSAGSLAHPSTRYNLIRPGISIYGLPPSPAVKLPEGIKPVLSWKSVLASIKELPPDHGVSYGHEYITSKNELIGVIPLGYADGYRRTTGNQVLINGVKTPVVGRVSMDQCMIKLDHVPDPQIGDEVVLIGKQGDLEITADEVAQTWDTINYEVTCGIGSRVPRVYLR